MLTCDFRLGYQYEGMNIVHVTPLGNLRRSLKFLGFSGENSLEHLISAASIAGPELAKALGITRDELSQAVEKVSNNASQIPAQALEIIRKADYRLGVAIDKIPAVTVAYAVALPAGTPCPPLVSLIPQMPIIQNQGQRGTCVSFAAIAAYEHFLKKAGAYQDLSEQFLYWNCKRSDGIPLSEGTWLGVALPLLARDGVCLETDWPYHAVPIAGNVGQNPPPAGSQLKALTYRVSSYNTLAPTSVSDIRQEICDQKCVAFSIPVFNSWYGSSTVANTGEITMPIPGEMRVGGHAMCLVGYEDLPNSPELGGGRFLVRNSWGGSWGISSPLGAGYGTIPYAYIAKFCSEAYSIG